MKTLFDLFSGICVIVVMGCYGFGVYHLVTRLRIDDWVDNLLDFLPNNQLGNSLGLILYLIIVLVIPLIIFIMAFIARERR